MSDCNIPVEIQMEVIERIPDIKSVIRCRSVSKAWKSVIDSKEFVVAHTLRNTTHDQAKPHLLIRKRDCFEGRTKWENDVITPVRYYSIVDDDDTFPNQKVSVFVPDSVHKFSYASLIILGGSHGLFCFYDKYETDTAVIWNPSIRKTVAIPVPKEPEYITVFGFGVCPQNLDPKLVKITCVYYYSMLQDVNASIQVEVFNVSSGGTWRSPLSGNLPHKSIRFGYSHVVVDGFIYWSASDSINVDDRFTYPKLIMSFYLTSEEFTKVNLPDPLALDPDVCLSLSILKESLAVVNLNHNEDTLGESCDVWMMIGHGCTRSFNKLYSIYASGALRLRNTLGFLKSGAPIIEVENCKGEYYEFRRELAVYGRESKSITNIGIHGLAYRFIMHSYMETLLLLNH